MVEDQWIFIKNINIFAKPVVLYWRTLIGRDDLNEPCPHAHHKQKKMPENISILQKCHGLLANTLEYYANVKDLKSQNKCIKNTVIANNN